MEALCWSDYLCPWCYVGQARDPIFEAHGITVVHLPFELHPEIPVEGRRVSATGRLAPTFDRVEAACADAGLPFRRPERMPNTRRALATAEWIRSNDPTAFAAVHRSLFAAHFATGDAIDDPDVLDDIVRRAGADPAAVHEALASGTADALVSASMADARQRGVTSTPTWILGDFAIPGALDAETLERWVTRLAGRGRAS